MVSFKIYRSQAVVVGACLAIAAFFWIRKTNNNAAQVFQQQPERQAEQLKVSNGHPYMPIDR